MTKKTIFYLCPVLLIFCILFFHHADSSEEKTVTLMANTPVETSYTIVDGNSPGKTIFIVGGIHGDETSGWMAAEQLKKENPPDNGTLIILSPANAPGSRSNTRNVEEYRDLNRSFPGERNRDLTDQLAASIYQTIETYSPDLVIDLHEAWREEGNRDFLGNSFLFTDAEQMGELLSTLILESQDGSLGTSAPFSYYNGTPRGSLNREVSERLQIPVITVEISKEDPLETRIENHMAILRRIISYYQMQ